MIKSEARPCWKLRRPAPRRRRAISDALGISPITAQLLVNRGLSEPDDARQFLNAGFEDIRDPAQLPGMGPAAERLAVAISRRQHVIVYGDSDADGLAATAIMTRLLRLSGCRVETFIPGRLTDGYGLSPETVERLIFAKPDLVVTVDCGITSIAEAAMLAEAGIDLIITDHHQPGESLPGAVAVVAARVPGSEYPFQDLSGAGVAFKLAWAVAQTMSPGRRVSGECREFLNDATALVALGTVADVCPLLDENRLLVRYGLKALAASRRAGLAALVGASRRRQGPWAGTAISSRDVAWSVAPLVNAAGRMGRPEVALELLLADDEAEAARLAAELTRMNAQRRALGRTVAEEAMAAAILEAGAPALVLASDTWHGGVLGPAANKISEHFGRPAALVAFDGEVGRGSARAPRGSRLHELLAVCTEHLDAHGGHDGAAGFTVRRADFDRFKDAFLRAAENSLGAAGEVPAPETNVEAEVPAPELTAALADEVSRLGPFGEGNPEPLLATLATAMAGTARPMGSGRSLSFRIKTGHGSSRVVGLGFAHKIQEIEALGKSGRLDMAYRLSRDARSGEAELMLEDFRPSA